ncbi:membrane hypothetical protein [Candidatus Magnetomoraceae bacterium gMMP-15]
MHSLFNVIIKYFYFISTKKLIKTIMSYVLWLTVFLFIVIINKKKMLIVSDFKLCLQSVLISLFSLIVLFSIVSFLTFIIFYLKEKWAHRHFRALSMAICTFLVLIWLNIYPIVYWINFYNNKQLEILYLLLSNMLLYYFVLHSYREIQGEKAKLYVTSAHFKGFKQYNYLREKGVWVMLNNIRPMFYHLFSFTLFTDLLVDGKSHQQGIVTHIFSLLKHNDDNFSMEMFVAVGVMVSILYPLKKVMEFPEKLFAFHYKINDNSHRIG